MPRRDPLPQHAGTRDLDLLRECSYSFDEFGRLIESRAITKSRLRALSGRDLRQGGDQSATLESGWADNDRG